MAGILEQILETLNRIADQNDMIAEMVKTEPTPIEEAVKEVAEEEKAPPKKKKRIVVQDKTEEKAPPKKVERPEVVKQCKALRDSLGRDALVKLWEGYGIEGLKDLPEDKYADMVGDIVDLLQKRVIEIANQLNKKDEEELLKKFKVDRLTDAKDDLGDVIKMIEAKLPEDEELA